MSKGAQPRGQAGTETQLPLSWPSHASWHWAASVWEERLLFIQRCLVLPTSYAHGAVSAQRRPFPSDKGTKGQPGTSMPWGGEERASIAASPPSGSDGDCSILSLLLAPLSSSLL